MEFLCEEILLEIFKLISNGDKQSISLTCKRFYHIICKLEKNKHQLNLTVENVAETHNSMIYSKRIFNKMYLKTINLDSLELYWKIKNVCASKGSDIKEFLWTFNRLTLTEVYAILNLFPNLKKLSCIDWKLRTEYYDELPVEKLKLKLNELTVKGKDEATYDFFNESLFEHSLILLNVDFYHENLISSQRNIRYLYVNDEEIRNEWIALPLVYLELSLRRYKLNNQSVLYKILQQQPNLEFLDIKNCTGIFDSDDESFIALCSLQHLKILKINIDDLSRVTFKEHFKKLDKLEELAFESVEHNYAPIVDILEEFSNTSLEFLKTLRIEIAHLSIPVSRINNMGRNLPNLSSFHLDCDHPLPVDIYLKNFHVLETLEINYHYSQEFALVCNNLDDFIFPSLKNIKLDGFNFGSDINNHEHFFLKLVQALPNIRTLNIEITIPLNLTFLPNVLQRLPRLKIIRGIHFNEKNEKLDINFLKNLISFSENVKEILFKIKLKSLELNLYDIKEMLQRKFINLKNIKTDIFGIELTIAKC